MHYYQHHIGDFRAGCFNMTRMERALYREMLDIYYDTESPLPDSIDSVCKLLGVRSAEEKSMVSEILLLKFEQVEGRGYVHERCEKEISEYRAFLEKSSRAGKASAAARANKKATNVQPESNQPSTSVEPTLNGGATNQQPLTTNQQPNKTKAFVSGEAEDLFARPAKPDCPHQEIIAIYHEVLPQCPAIRDWTPARASQLRARWNEHPDRQNLDYWRNLFAYIAECDFLVGRSAKPFFADLEWITKSSNFTKIREGKYENR